MLRRMLASRRSGSRLVCAVALGLACAVTRARAQGFYNMELLSHTDEFAGGRGAYASCWGYTAPDGTELAIIGTVNGTAIYDVTDPRRPVQVASIEGPRSQWREMQTWSHYCYVVTEGVGTESRGMQIIDLADPRTPIHVGDYDSTFVTAHTIHIAAGYAYVNGTTNGFGTHILDLADPVHPREVGGWHTRYVHDCYVRGNLGYMANIQNGGFTILDLSDKSQPKELSFTQYPGAFTHNCWTTQDGHFLLTTDEVAGGHLRVWDVVDSHAPSEVAEWSAQPNASIHNVIVHGDSAYIAYYTEGVQVLDVSRPVEPRIVGYYDTYPGVSAGFEGVWGVYPFARSGNIYASDIQGGLFVLRMGTGGQPVVDFNVHAPETQTTLPVQGPLMLYFDIFNGAGAVRTFDLVAMHDLGWPITAPASVTIGRDGLEPVLVTVQVPPSVSSATRGKVTLCVTQRVSGFQVCVATHIAVPVALQSFEAVATAAGNELRWALRRDAGDAGRLEVWRAVHDARAGPVTAEPDWQLRTTRALDESEWLDADVEPGADYRYRLVWSAAGGPQVLGEAQVRTDAPRRTRLLGATPNPFNPSTRIRFELAHGSDVQLLVHDARGRLVRRIVAVNLAPGEHAIAWDGRDDRGGRQPSGIYLYELRGETAIGHGRMTLAK